MTNLMSAHLFRLKKSRLFWGCLLISAAAGAWQSIQTFLEHGPTVPLDSIFFVYAMLIGLLLAVFLPCSSGRSTATAPSATSWPRVIPGCPSI